MKFEISYRGGTTHQVELSGSVAVLGRDPVCDVVLNDPKCSRRHATVEDLPEGLVVRDAGSANGTHVNGRRTERARLRPGDTIRIGDVLIKVLADVGETVVVAPDDLELRTSVAVPPAPLPTPVESPSPVAEARPPDGLRAERRHQTESDARRATAPVVLVEPVVKARRPATVNLLVALWAAFVPLSAAAVLFATSRFGEGALVWGLAGVACLLLAGLGTAMALGLRALAPWARQLQIAAAGVGLLACPFTLASATVLLYLTRPEVRAVFEGRAPRPRRQDGTAEATYALSLVGMLLLGLALTAIAALFV